MSAQPPPSGAPPRGVPLGLSFDPDRPVAQPRDAATVLVLRDRTRGEGGAVEVYCVQRHGRSPFLGGAIVFPGGKVDERDGAHEIPPGTVVAKRLDQLGHALPHALLVAAARELFEEAAILCADVDHPTSLSLRASGKPIDEMVRYAGVRLRLEGLVPFSRWITPEAEPRRFDARFFVLRCPNGQEGTPDARETTQGFWATPREVLERFHAGDVQLAPPTTRSLELLRDVRSVDEAFALAEKLDLRPICPRFVPGDPPFLALPGDPAHEIKERYVDGPTRFVLRDGKLLSEDP